MTDYLLHFVFPNTCLFCRTPIVYESIMCDNCAKHAPFINSTSCTVCEKEECSCEHTFSKLICPFYYEMGCDNAVRDLKFHHNRLNARKLAIYLAQAVLKNGVKIDIILPIPLYPKDYRQRGYNQSELLAKHVSNHLQIPMKHDVLLKVKKTLKQHDLNMEERKNNLNDAFLVKQPELIKDKTVLLVDDVFTTGMTMETCSKILINNGAQQVIGLAVAKTRRSSSINNA